MELMRLQSPPSHDSFSPFSAVSKLLNDTCLLAQNYLLITLLGSADFRGLRQQ
jgi:hypothetical protein